MIKQYSAIVKVTVYDPSDKKILNCENSPIKDARPHELPNGAQFYSWELAVDKEFGLETLEFLIQDVENHSKIFQNLTSSLTELHLFLLSSDGQLNFTMSSNQLARVASLKMSLLLSC